MRIIHRVIIIDARLLLNNLRLGAAAGHGAAQEDVDEQHDAEQDTERDTEPREPGGVGVGDGAEAGTDGTRRPRLRHVHGGRDGDGVISLVLKD